MFSFFRKKQPTVEVEKTVDTGSGTFKFDDLKKISSAVSTFSIEEGATLIGPISKRYKLVPTETIPELKEILSKHPDRASHILSLEPEIQSIIASLFAEGAKHRESKDQLFDTDAIISMMVIRAAAVIFIHNEIEWVRKDPKWSTASEMEKRMLIIAMGQRVGTAMAASIAKALDETTNVELRVLNN